MFKGLTSRPSGYNEEAHRMEIQQVCFNRVAKIRNNVLDYRGPRSSRDGEILGNEILTDDWLRSCRKRLISIRDFCDGVVDWDFNFEMVPAEGASRTLAESNNIHYKRSDRFYSNQFVPLYLDVPVTDRLRIESELCQLVSGGTMTFININGQPDKEAMLNLQKTIIKATKIPQFAINIGISRCEDCDESFSGKFEKCPDCGGETEIFTRVVGYFVSTKQWSPRRQEEFDTRHWYNRI
jgi:ribonucleoside-triphosphate reductase